MESQELDAGKAPPPPTVESGNQMESQELGGATAPPPPTVESGNQMVSQELDAGKAPPPPTVESGNQMVSQELGASNSPPPPSVPGSQHASAGTVAAAGAAGAGAGGALATAGMFASSVSAYIECIDYPIPTITFSYNPEGYKDEVTSEWAEKRNPANNGTVPQFKGTKTAGMDVKILLDAFSMPRPLLPPAEVIRNLKMLVLPTADSIDANHPAAPRVMFGWGSNVILAEAYVKKVTVQYERFMLGVPVRATATVSLQEYPTLFPLGGTNPTSGGLATRRTHTVVEGDTLASVAYKEYKDASRWRALAEANGIDDPMRVRVGTVITVPDKQQAQARG